MIMCCVCTHSYAPAYTRPRPHAHQPAHSAPRVPGGRQRTSRSATPRTSRARLRLSIRPSAFPPTRGRPPRRLCGQPPLFESPGAADPRLLRCWSRGAKKRTADEAPPARQGQLPRTRRSGNQVGASGQRARCCPRVARFRVPPAHSALLPPARLLPLAVLHTPPPPYICVRSCDDQPHSGNAGSA